MHDVENWVLPALLAPDPMTSNDVHDAVRSQYAFASSSVMPSCVGSSFRPMHERTGTILYSFTAHVNVLHTFPVLMKSAWFGYTADLLSMHDVENWTLQFVVQPFTMFSNDEHDAVRSQYAFASSSVMPVCVGSSFRPAQARPDTTLYSSL